MKPKKTTYFLFVVAMLAMAILDNVRGVFVPSFKSTYQMSNTDIGVLFLVSSFAYMISSFYSGIGISRYNHQRMLRFGAFATILGVLSIALTSSVVLFFGGMIAINIGIAAIALCINTTVPLLQVKHKAVIMNGIHFLYGIGATFTQKTTGVLLGMGMAFKVIYLGIALIFILLALVSHWLPLPPATAHKKEKVHFTKAQKTLLIVFSLALGLYVTGELQTANWLVNYLKTGFNMAESDAANITATFFLVFSLGRLFGGFVVQKFGYLRTVIWSLTIASVLYFIGLSMGLPGAWLIAASGIFFAVAYPTAMLVVAEYFDNAVSQAAGIIITASAGVNMIMGLVIGYLSDQFSIHVAMYLLPTVVGLSAILFLWLYTHGGMANKKSTSIE